MAKLVADNVLDAALTVIKTAVTRMVICSAAPANFAGVAAVALADVDMADADFTIADGTVSGRKVTVAAKADIPVDVTAEATHLALVDDDNARLLYLTTCPAQAVAAGGMVSTGAWPIEIRDPV